MSRKKATLLAVGSLASLGKVRSSHHHRFHFSRTFSSLNTQTTLPADDSIDSHDSCCGYGVGQENHGDFSSDYQNPGGFQGVYGEKLNYQNSYQSSQYSANAPPQNFHGGYGSEFTANYQHRIGGQGGGSGANSVSQSSQGGAMSSQNLGINGIGSDGVYQGRHGSNIGYIDGPSHGNGHYGGNTGQIWPNSNDHSTANDWIKAQSSVDHNTRNGGSNQHSIGYSHVGNTSPPQQFFGYNQIGYSGSYQQNGVTNQQSTGYPHVRNITQHQPCYANNQTGNNFFYQQNGGTNQHCPGHFHVGNATPLHQFLGNNQSGNNGFHQQYSENRYTGNTGVYQPSLKGHQSVDAGGSWSNEPQNQVVASQALGTGTPVGESTDNNRTRGTLEELDDFCKDGKVKEAVDHLKLLKNQATFIDLPRYLTLMKVCGDEKVLEEAKVVHDNLAQSVSSLKTSTYNRIIEMYARCGSMDDANNVFNKMPERNLSTWDTMISWYSKNGLGEDALDLFNRFKETGLKPDGQMFIGIFAACAAVDDINEGFLHFASMSKEYGIVPSMKHYVAIVDMLGSSGYLDEAWEFIEKMPVEPSIEVWETLMNLSRAHGKLELGDRCAQMVEQMDPSRLSKESKDGLLPLKASDLAREKKKSAQNSLEIKSRVHEYRAGDRSHPENDKIYALLRGMKEQMKEDGYIPETRFVLHDIDPEGKEEALMAHSERLAVAYGLMTSSARSPIRVIKNLRVCVDCHNALKIISKLVGRELIMRDAKRFHHMKDGKCSCNDYW